MGEPKKTPLLVLTTDLMESQRTYNTKRTILQDSKLIDRAYCRWGELAPLDLSQAHQCEEEWHLVEADRTSVFTISWHRLSTTIKHSSPVYFSGFYGKWFKLHDLFVTLLNTWEADDLPLPNKAIIFHKPLERMKLIKLSQWTAHSNREIWAPVTSEHSGETILHRWRVA